MKFQYQTLRFYIRIKRLFKFIARDEFKIHVGLKGLLGSALIRGHLEVASRKRSLFKELVSSNTRSLSSSRLEKDKVCIIHHRAFVPPFTVYHRCCLWVFGRFICGASIKYTLAYRTLSLSRFYCFNNRMSTYMYIRSISMQYKYYETTPLIPSSYKC